MPGECVRAQDLAPGMIPTVTEITRRGGWRRYASDMVVCRLLHCLTLFSRR